MKEKGREGTSHRAFQACSPQRAKNSSRKSSPLPFCLVRQPSFSASEPQENNRKNEATSGEGLLFGSLLVQHLSLLLDLLRIGSRPISIIDSALSTQCTMDAYIVQVDPRNLLTVSPATRLKEDPSPKRRHQPPAERRLKAKQCELQPLGAIKEAIKEAARQLAKPCILNN